jgi:hypothetical protein
MAHNNQPDLTITTGCATLYYCFDTGYEIYLKRLEKIRGKTARESLLTYTRLTPPYIQYRVPPIRVKLGKKRMLINDQSYEISVDAKIFDFGVVIIRITLPISGTLSQLHKFSTVLTEHKAFRKKAVTEFKKIRAEILPTIVNPREQAEDDFEDYCIFSIQTFDKQVAAEDLLNTHRLSLARVLRGEVDMSTTEVNESLKYPLSYHLNDLTLIDWNAAFIYDPEASYDIPDVIEFALIQLLELRLYDHMLDTIIDKSYDTLMPARHRLFPFSSTLRSLVQIKLDVSEIIDRLENRLKLIGDVFLAKVYETAARRFYLEHWKSATRSKLSTIESLFNTTWTRVQTNRMVILETGIVVLFIIDIILILIELL